MRILVDMNLSPEWVTVLQKAGLEAQHWSELGPQDTPDEDIMAFAADQGAIILTRDLDFGASLALTGQTQPSVVQVRARRASAARSGDLVVRALEATRDALRDGALVTVDLDRVRVRLLPFHQSH